MRRMSQRIAALVMAVVMVLPCIASCERKRSPLETIEDAINVSITASAKNTANALMEKIYTGGSMELRAEAGAFLGMIMGSMNSNLNLSASLKYYTDVTHGKAALTAALASGGVSVADALLYIADKSVSLSSSALFGKDVYGFSLDNFVENFNNSEFGEDGAYSLDIPKENLESLRTSLDQISTETVIDTVKQTKEMDSSWKKLKKDLYPMIESHGVIETVEGTLDVGGTSYTTKDIVFAYTGDQLTDLCVDTLTMLRDHQAVYSLLESYVDVYTTYYPAASIVIMDEEYSGEELTADALHAELVSFIDTILAETDSMREEIKNFNFRIPVHISTSSKEVIGVGVYAEEEGNSADIRFVFGPSVTDIDEIGVYIKAYSADDEEWTEASTVYLVTRDDEEAYSANISATGDAEFSLMGVGANLFKIDWDKKDGDYTISMSVDGQTMGIRGEVIVEEDTLTMTATSIITQGITINFGEIALIFRANDPMPENGAYTDVLKMNEEQIDALVSEVSAVVEQITSLFDGLLN